MIMDLCPDGENVVRALLKEQFDFANNRITASAVQDPDGVSVSRLVVREYYQIMVILHHDLRHHRYGPIVGTGEISVGNLRRIASSYKVPLKLDVREDATNTNPAHAVFTEYVKQRGLANKICEEMQKKLRMVTVSAP